MYPQVGGENGSRFPTRTSDNATSTRKKREKRREEKRREATHLVIIAISHAFEN
jgi:hypothetical protein